MSEDAVRARGGEHPECEFLEWERGIGSLSLITLRFRRRTRDIVTGYCETVALAMKA